MRFAALVSDTHGLLRPEVLVALRGAAMILHMGDVGSESVLRALEAIAPLHAVRGNVDYGRWAEALPATREVEVFGKVAYLLHDLGALDLDPHAAGIRYVLYGHTHVPTSEERDGVLYVNPGSIGPRRFDHPVSWAILAEDGSLRFSSLGR